MGQACFQVAPCIDEVRTEAVAAAEAGRHGLEFEPLRRRNRRVAGAITAHRQVGQPRRAADQQQHRRRLGQHVRQSEEPWPRRGLVEGGRNIRPQVAFGLDVGRKPARLCHQFVIVSVIHVVHAAPSVPSCCASRRLARCSCALLVPTAMPSISPASSWL